MAETDVQLQKGEKQLNAAYKLVLKGIPLISEPVEELVESYILRYGRTDEAIEKFVKNQKLKCATSGFLSGLGGALTMIVTIPADLASTLYMQLRMIAGIAYIRGFDLREDGVKTMIYLCLVGNAASSVLNQVGIKITEKFFAKKVIPLLSRKVTTKINQMIGGRIITKAGSKGIINASKAVPLIGGLFGAVWNWAEVAVVAKFAKKHLI